MKKTAIVGIVVIAFIAYAVSHNNSQLSLSTTTGGNGITTSVSTGAQRGIYKDGTYTGSAADAFYGTLQVQASIQNGRLSDVQFLQYPNDRNESVQINQQAMPILKQEAIQAQSATVDIVSGATDSSQAFMQSLASALSQAK